MQLPIPGVPVGFRNVGIRDQVHKLGFVQRIMEIAAQTIGFTPLQEAFILAVTLQVHDGQWKILWVLADHDAIHNQYNCWQEEDEEQEQEVSLHCNEVFHTQGCDVGDVRPRTFGAIFAASANFVGRPTLEFLGYIGVRFFCLSDSDSVKTIFVLFLFLTAIKNIKMKLFLNLQLTLTACTVLGRPPPASAAGASP